MFQRFAASTRISVVAMVTLTAMVLFPAKSYAKEPWVPQLSARLGTGLGSTLGDLHKELLWESHIRGELLFGKRGDWRFRLGPALELRAVDFGTIEYAAGGAFLLPIARGYPIVVSALLGYAHRRVIAPNGPVFVATVAWGYRSFNYHHVWQTGLQIYASTRMHINNPRHIEFTAGIEVDFGTTIIPILALRMALSRGDPDEPADPDGPNGLDDNE